MNRRLGSKDDPGRYIGVVRIAMYWFVPCVYSYRYSAGLRRLTTIFFQGMFTGKNIFPLKIDTHVDGIGVKKGTTRNEQGSSRVGKIAQP